MPDAKHRGRRLIGFPQRLGVSVEVAALHARDITGRQPASIAMRG
jgi:hypothetical protein